MSAEPCLHRHYSLSPKQWRCLDCGETRLATVCESESFTSIPSGVVPSVATDATPTLDAERCAKMAELQKDLDRFAPGLTDGTRYARLHTWASSVATSLAFRYGELAALRADLAAARSLLREPERLTLLAATLLCELGAADPRLEALRPVDVRRVCSGPKGKFDTASSRPLTLDEAKSVIANYEGSGALPAAPAAPTPATEDKR